MFEAGRLGREVRVLSALLAVCLIAMLLTGEAETPTAAVADTFGLGSYL